MTVPLPANGDQSWDDWAGFVHTRVTTTLDGKAATTHTHAVADINATGTRDATTFLRGDGTWSTTPAAAGAADATTSSKGIVQLANHLGGTATSPTVRSATDTQTGIVELATTAEATTGTDATRAVTPAGLKAVADTKVGLVLTKRTITTAYTLVVADATDIVLHSTAASAVTITLPTDATAAIGQEIAIPWRQYGAGQITFAPAAGVTLQSRGSVFKSAGQYAEGMITKVAANTWVLSGDIV